MNNNGNRMENAIRLPIGVSDFNKVASGGYHFADKTLFIKEVMSDGSDVVLITRPRRFGKTLNLSMLHYFLQKNQPQDKNIFDGLAISQDTEFCRLHQNQYPVIFVSFKDIKQSSYEEAYGDVVVLMKNLYSAHAYLLEDEQCLREHERVTFNALLNQTAERSNIVEAIKQLSEYLARKFNKPPVILIDEYDTPLQEAYLKGYYEPMIELMRSIFGKALKDNLYMHKAVITGITRIAQEGLFSGVNNLRVYSLLQEKYGQYFGFTESEVTKLIKDTGQHVHIEALREWYNGYKVGGRHVVYNPWSILLCLSDSGKLAPYWLNTSSNDLIKELIMKADYRLQNQFELLMQRQAIEKPLMENLVFTDLDKHEEAVWSLLLYAGYLNVLSTRLDGFRLMAQICVPNKEVLFVYERMIADWFRSGMSLNSYDTFVRSLINGDMDKFKRYLSDYIMEAGSYFDFNTNTPEKVFHSFMLGLVIGLKENYVIQSNQESGRGRLDVIFIPKNKQQSGILLEFKVSATADLLLDKAQEALAQIKDQQYIGLLKNHGITSVLAIGLAFCGKQVELAHEHLTV